MYYKRYSTGCVDDGDRVRQHTNVHEVSSPTSMPGMQRQSIRRSNTVISYTKPVHRVSFHPVDERPSRTYVRSTSQCRRSSTGGIRTSRSALIQLPGGTVEHTEHAEYRPVLARDGFGYNNGHTPLTGSIPPSMDGYSVDVREREAYANGVTPRMQSMDTFRAPSRDHYTPEDEMFLVKPVSFTRSGEIDPREMRRQDSAAQMQSIVHTHSSVVHSQDATVSRRSHSVTRRSGVYEPVVERLPVKTMKDVEYSGFTAAKVGNVVALEEALDDGLDMNVLDGDKYTMLMWASRMGHVPVALALLRRGAKPDISGGEMLTPLMLASKHGNTHVAELLLQYQANPNLSDGKLHSPLMYACANGHRATVEVLLQFGANPHWVARSATNTNGVNGNGMRYDRHFRFSPGGRAAQDWQGQGEGKTAMHCAARYGYTPIIAILVQLGCNVNAQDDKGRTPIFWATVNGHYESVRALSVSRVDIPDIEGSTPLMWACRLGNRGIAKLLIDSGADVNYCAPGDYSRGPLMWAMQYSDNDMVTMMRSHGATVGSRLPPPESCDCCFLRFS